MKKSLLLEVEEVTFSITVCRSLFRSVEVEEIAFSIAVCSFSTTRIQIEEKLPEAIRNGDIVPVYQPIVSSTTRRAVAIAAASSARGPGGSRPGVPDRRQADHAAQAPRTSSPSRTRARTTSATTITGARRVGRRSGQRPAGAGERALGVRRG